MRQGGYPAFQSFCRQFHGLSVKASDRSLTRLPELRSQPAENCRTYHNCSSNLSRPDSYAYFLQEWEKHSWDVAPGPTITKEDVTQATTIMLAALDASFFWVRLDRLRNATDSPFRH